MAARRAGMRFISFPVPDHGTPTDAQHFEKLLNLLENLTRERRRIGIHCRACIGRSSVLAASLLVRLGMKNDEVWKQIRAVRGVPVPETSEQREFVDSQVRQKPWHLL
jgi:protein-tyrosine phosphatase